MSDARSVLETIITALLPPGEPFHVMETCSTDRLLVLTIDCATNKGRSIVMGREAKTIEAIRRLMYIAAFNWNRRLSIELKGDIVREQHATSTVR
jgi:predicted RNA-binding protein YlqC (UPF0109 family)